MTLESHFNVNFDETKAFERSKEKGTSIAANIRRFLFWDLHFMGNSGD